MDAVDAAVESTTASVGLTAAEVRDRVARGQVNDVPARSSRSTGAIIRSNVFTFFNALIGVLFVIMLAVGPIQDTLFGLVVIANTAIGIIQELRAKRTLDKLAIVNQAVVRAVRDGDVVELGPNDVVLDDVLRVATGDKAVVDGVVVEARGLEIDESLLTGEADPVVKRPGDPMLSGSFVVAGSGAFQATKVGRDAYAAALAEEASRFTLVHSEIRTDINRFLKFITYVLVPTSILLAFTQLTNDSPWREAVSSTIAGIVPMIPEGLVLLTSIAFAVSVVRLAQRKCLVQELPAVEGLARVNVVCADKTGTLTENRMSLVDVRKLTESDVDPTEVLAALAANDSRPNASTLAIAEVYSTDPKWTVEAVAPFSSARRWSGASFTGRGNWVLGAPERWLTGADASTVDELNQQGMRVLLLARGQSLVDADGAPGEVEPVALVVLEQTVRSDAAETLRYFADQDVAVKVISGDNPVSVGAVARKLGLPGAEHPVDGSTLPEDIDELADELDRNSVFGRVAPHQKRAMVKALQSRGNTVAMTGDGVNDVLALKDADIGVAMGAGSDATRAVAQIVLMDNKFASLPRVVGEGRRVVGNIERVSTLFLTKTAYGVLFALATSLVSFFSSLEYPFLPRHLTLISGLTIGIPGFFLALTPNNERARGGMVARVLRLAVPGGVVAFVVTFLSYLLARIDTDSSLASDRTIATITLATVAFGVLVTAARPLNWWKWLLILGLIGLFVLALAVPLASKFFALEPHSMLDVGQAVAIGAVGWVVVEVIHQFRTWHRKRNGVLR